MRLSCGGARRPTPSADPLSSPRCCGRRQATDSEIAVKIIVGGITNRLYRLLWQDKVRVSVFLLALLPRLTLLLLPGRQSVLIRLYGDNTEAFIDRSVENSTRLDTTPCWHPRPWI